MQVNISRSKLLINKKRFSKPVKKKTKPAPKCNHCGGLVRENGEIVACIMCGREEKHYCGNCQFAHPSEIAEDNKKAPDY